MAINLDRVIQLIESKTDLDRKMALELIRKHFETKIDKNFITDLSSYLVYTNRIDCPYINEIIDITRENEGCYFRSFS